MKSTVVNGLILKYTCQKVVFDFFILINPLVSTGIGDNLIVSLNESVSSTNSNSELQT